MKRLMIPAAALVCIAAFSLSAQTITVGARAPTISVPDLDGKPVAIAVTSGKRAAVVEFWATWCEVCRALLPEMRSAAAKYGSQVDFYGVDVTVNDPEARVRRYVAEEHPPFVAVYDKSGAAVRAFGATETSHVVIVDDSGHVAYIGDGSDQKISAELGRLMSREL